VQQMTVRPEQHLALGVGHPRDLFDRLGRSGSSSPAGLRGPSPAPYTRRASFFELSGRGPIWARHVKVSTTTSTMPPSQFIPRCPGARARGRWSPRWA
jgi:hypothetical protein